MAVTHHHDVCAGRDSAPGVAGWLGLAAAPTFALMALWTAAASEPPDVFCTQHGPALGGMTAMYLLMSAFHAAPWLKRISGR